MPTAVSQTEIVNAALARLGSLTRIVSIDDSGQTAAAAREHWRIELLELFADYPWNFAIVRAMLNEASPAPEHGWAHAYALPADCLRWLPPSVEDECWFEGVREGDLILTDAEAPLAVRYLSSERVHDWRRWPAHFAQVMSARLAAAMAETVTSSQGVARDMAERAYAVDRRAKRIDAMESGNQSRAQVARRSNWAGSMRRTFNPNAR